MTNRINITNFIKVGWGEIGRDCNIMQENTKNISEGNKIISMGQFLKHLVQFSTIYFTAVSVQMLSTISIHY